MSSTIACLLPLLPSPTIVCFLYPCFPLPLLKASYPLFSLACPLPFLSHSCSRLPPSPPPLSHSRMPPISPSFSHYCQLPTLASLSHSSLLLTPYFLSPASYPFSTLPFSPAYYPSLPSPSPTGNQTGRKQILSNMNPVYCRILYCIYTLHTTLHCTEYCTLFNIYL